MNSITVIGSVNLDMVASAPRLPVPGETVTDAVLSTHPGGKGANQALAARRMGADVSMIGRVGSDPNAVMALALLRDGGVDLDGVRVDDTAVTGVAMVVVDADGENQIVVAPGANRMLTAEDVRVGEAGAVICQLEIPLEAVVEAGRQTTGLFCLNAAPVRPLPNELIEMAPEPLLVCSYQNLLYDFRFQFLVQDLLIHADSFPILISVDQSAPQ